MIRGANLSKIHIICGNHEEETEMVMTEGVRGMSGFYSCPKYVPASDPSDNIYGSCFNRLNTTDYMRMLDKLAEEKYDTETGERIALKGLKFEIKRIQYSVIKEEGDEIWVSIKNNNPLKY